jgi:mannose-6-phosphate isomerase
MEHDFRPWGEYWVLEDKETHKVKRIEVKSGGRLSYQYHHHRSEVWTVIAGIATVTIEGEEKDYHPGEVIRIPVLAKHRVANKGESQLTFIEVQFGTYFGEDDIIRLEDDYARKSED